jgi:hypothetical protein
MKYVHLIWLPSIATMLVYFLSAIQCGRERLVVLKGHPVVGKRWKTATREDLLVHAVSNLHRGRKRFFWITQPKYRYLEDFAISLPNPSHPLAATFCLYSLSGTIWERTCFILRVVGATFGLVFICIELLIWFILEAPNPEGLWAGIMVLMLSTPMLGFLLMKLVYINSEHLRVCGLKLEMAQLSHDLRKACLTESSSIIFTDSEWTEYLQRQNLETCIKALFPEEEGDTPEDIEKKWEVYIKPTLEDIVLSTDAFKSQNFSK